MFEDTLLAAMYRATCPTTDEITDYLIGTMSKQARLAIEAHVARCKLCSQEVATLRAIFVTNEAEATETVVAEPLWQQVKDLLQTTGDQLGRILTPKALVSPTNKGMSFTKGFSKRQVLNYQDGTLSVMLSLEKSGDWFTINGNVLHEDDTPEAPINGTVELVNQNESQERYLTLLDDDETFTFKAIPAGHFDMNIYDTGGAVLHIADIPVRDADTQDMNNAD